MDDQNIIIYDWLSFTFKSNDPYYIVSVLGLDHVHWENTKGAHGYRDRLYFNCISIHYNGRDDMGVWCEISGQGCRTFESLSDLPEGRKWEKMFQEIYADHMHITRLDVAYDDHIGLLNINQMILNTRLKEYVSKSDYWEVIESSKGQSIQFGSPTSEILIRIYDKAAERNCDPGTHWIRCELQLRRDRAARFLDLVQSGMTIGEAFCGVVINYLRFVEPDPLDSNRWRWPIKEYWGDMLCSAQAIKLYQAPGMEYNLDRCRKYVIGQAGYAIKAYIDCVGKDQFFRELDSRTYNKNPKYERLVEAYKSLEI